MLHALPAVPSPARRRLATLCAALALALVALGAARAQAYVYYVTGQTEIGRANLDGTGANDRFISDVSAPFQFTTRSDNIDAGLYSSGLAVDSTGI